MPIRHQWIIPKRVIYVRWHGEITVAETQKANFETARFLAEGIPPIHMLRDDSAVTTIPPVTLRQILDTLKAVRNPDFGWAVTIGYSNPFIGTLTNLYSKFTRIRIHRTKTLEEALAFLKQADVSLNLDEVQWDIPHS